MSDSEPLGRHWPISGFAAIAIVVAIEVVRQFQGMPQARTLRQITKFRSPTAPAGRSLVRVRDVTSKILALRDRQNLFVSYSSRKSQIPFPLVDMLGSEGTVGDAEPKFVRDEFAFRNWHGSQIFFEPRDLNSPLIVFFGNSEAAGFAHHVPIAQHLENQLRKTDPKVRVINLAVGASSISHALNLYIYFAHHLKPDAVILHNGGSELAFSMRCVPACVQLGLLYDPLQHSNMVQLADRTAQLPYAQTRRIYENDWRLGIAPISRLATTFRQLVESHGGEFVFGLQKIDTDNEQYKEDYHDANDFYSALGPELTSAGVRVISFQHEPIAMLDNIHSKSESASVIAERYAQLMRSLLHKRLSGMPSSVE